MLYVAATFDRVGSRVYPLRALVFKEKKIYKYVLFEKGTGVKLYDVYRARDKIRELISSNATTLTGFKTYLRAFEMDLNIEYDVIDACISPSDDLKEQIAQVAQATSKKWNKTFANAQVAYEFLERRGAYRGPDKLDIQYEFTTTGRSKTKGTNIQGSTKEDDLRLEETHEFYVYFDWIAADLRVMSHMSGDVMMEESFKLSDPYSYVTDELGDIDRGDIKTSFLAGVYSLSPDEEIFGLFPEFQQWFKSQIKKMDIDGYLETMCGRRFCVDGDNQPSVMSGMVQGSVAHAMHNVMIRVYEIFPYNILTETHDGITMVCHVNDVKHIIKKITEIMLRPFDSDLVFPLKVYVGRRYKDWKLLREYR